ncbi:MAG: 2-C-methyl-D-erythritol 4-phosphate cytidylyltransferase [Pseudonocardiaceae bacterium]|nr:2-C-methyl-D-erythritol 4-phosphate cytidylyltransferase [Pseudonocardiaceae bacterium]
MDVAALVSVVGQVGRAGSGAPNAWTPVRGEPLLTHAVRSLLASECVAHVFVSASASDVDRTARAVSGLPATVLEAGEHRNDALRLGLRTAQAELPRLSVILLHDPTRAFAPPALTRSVVDAVRAGAPAAVPVLPVADTIKQVNAEGVVLGTQDRGELRAPQTPQGFAVDVLCAACAADTPPLDHVAAPVTVPGHPYAVKIATPFDLTAAEAVFAGDEHTVGVHHARGSR